jgi:hypothetical protein
MVRRGTPKRGTLNRAGEGLISHALADLNPEKSFVVYNGQERFPLSDRTQAIGLVELARALQAVGSKQ